MKIFTNAEFISCEDDSKTFSVLAAHKGKIVYTGDELPKHNGRTRLVDLGGATVVPIFGDTHIHFESYSFFLSNIDVRDSIDFNDMGTILRDYAKNNPEIKTLIAFGCSEYNLAEKRLPYKTDLDKMTDKPLLMTRYDGHTAVANTAFTSELPPDVTNDEGYDEDTGSLSGTAFYKAIKYATSSVSLLKIVSGMELAANTLAKSGIGYIHAVSGVGFENDIDVDALRIVRYGLPQCIQIFFQTLDIDKVTRRKMSRVGGCFELALDGCFDAKDAAVSGGYADEPENKGVLFYTQQQINDFCIKANRLGLQISLHATGDLAVEQVLTAYEAALADHPRKDHRHTIIHAELMPPSLIERAAALEVAVALQPIFLRCKEEPHEYLEQILGKRINEQMPMRDLIDAGLLLSAGSDAPCVLPNPIESIHNCCNHPNPAQSVTPLEALKMHTSWGAKMCFDEKERGSLTIGKTADFVVLSKNPLKVPADSLNEIKVTDTYFKGKRFNASRKPSLFKLAVRIVTNKLFKNRSVV